MVIHGVNNMSVDKQKLYELAKKVKTDFLNTEDYKMVLEKEKKKPEDLVNELLSFLVNELFDLRPELVESGDVEKIQEIVEWTFPASIQRRIGLNMTDVQVVPVGLSESINYIGAYISAANKKYDEAQEKLQKGDRSLWEKCIVDKWFDENGTPLERRRKKGELYGKAYPKESSFFCNILLWGKSPDGSGDFIFQDSLGGETDDTSVNLICPRCKTQSVTKKCPKCGEVKKFFDYEDIARSCFHQFMLPIAMRKQKIKVGNIEREVMTMKWSKETVIPREKTPISKEVMLKILQNSEVQKRTVKMQDLEKVYLDHVKEDGKPDRGFWVCFSGVAIDIPVFPDKKGRWVLTLSQKGSGFMSPSGKAVVGVKVMVPSHVWMFMGGNTIGKYSNVVAFGNIDRRESWTKQTGTIHGQYEPPELNAWGFFVLDATKPKHKIEDDVIEGPKEIDTGDDFDIPQSGVVFGDIGTTAPKPAPVPVAASAPIAAKPAAARPGKPPANPVAVSSARPVLPAASDEKPADKDWY